MAKILVIYGTTHGQAEKVAHFMGNELRSQGYVAEVFHAKECPREIPFETYDGVIVGASVHASGYQRPLVRWVKQNARRLDPQRSMFFSVCLGVLQKDPEVLAQENFIVERFFEQVGWRPKRWHLIAGGLPYLRYNWLIRQVMRNISAKAGGDTDTSRNYEYTDWDQVRRILGAFTAGLGVQPTLASASR